MSHICIIEDDAAIAEIERDYLEINGFTVSIATDGVSGLNLTQKESFDLILLDLMLPQLDGFTLCRKLRERLDIPILMVTAKKEDIDKIRGLGLGADDYIVKPFSPGELVARVQAHIATYQRLKAPQERHIVSFTTLTTVLEGSGVPIRCTTLHMVRAITLRALHTLSVRWSL